MGLSTIFFSQKSILNKEVLGREYYNLESIKKDCLTLMSGSRYCMEVAKPCENINKMISMKKEEESSRKCSLKNCI